MAVLIAYDSRAGESYFGGDDCRIRVGNTAKAAHRAKITRGRAIHGSHVDEVEPTLQTWDREVD